MYLPTHLSESEFVGVLKLLLRFSLNSMELFPLVILKDHLHVWAIKDRI